jgi:pathogenesis-related protein 1
MQGMTAAHNAARASIDPPPAAPIPLLSWSSEVASAAQMYAAQCIFEHSGLNYGENIFATSGSAAPSEVVHSWIAEAVNYDYASNSCSGDCGHYTQVVWAASLRLGCGVANCTQNSPFGSGSWQIWICDYDPAGNSNGERPY